MYSLKGKKEKNAIVVPNRVVSTWLVYKGHLYPQAVSVSMVQFRAYPKKKKKKTWTVFRRQDCQFFLLQGTPLPLIPDHGKTQEIHRQISEEPSEADYRKEKEAAESQQSIQEAPRKPQQRRSSTW